MHTAHDDAVLSPQRAARNLLVQLVRAQKATADSELSPEIFYPVRVDEIVERILEWRLSESESDSDDIAKGYCDFKNRTIEISGAIPTVGERNFTVAHEIGHAILHKDSKTCVHPYRISARRRIKLRIDDSESARREREADLFATELLMPTKAVRAAFSRQFQREKLWTLSEHASAFLPRASASNRPARGLFDSALALASSKGVSGRSLAEFFGAPPYTVAKRLVELNLLY